MRVGIRLLMTTITLLGGCGTTPRSGSTSDGSVLTPPIPMPTFPDTPDGSVGAGVAVGGAIGSLSGGAVSEFAAASAGRLDNLAATLSGDAAITLNGASSNLAALIQQFKTMLKGNLAVPLDTLGGDVLDAAGQLNSLATRLDFLLRDQQADFFRGLGVFVAGVESAALDAKRGFLFAPAGAPRLYYFAFAGARPYAIPTEGGRVTLFGYRLWEHSAPDVIIVDESRRVLLSLTPGRGQGDNSVSVVIPAVFVRSHAGELLEFRVRPRRSTAPDKELFLGVAIPRELKTACRVVASIEYGVPQKAEEKLGAQKFRFDNNSCEDRKDVSARLIWSLPTGGNVADARIVRFEDHKGEEHLKSSVSITIQGTDSIAAAGWLDKAKCVGTLGQNKLLQETTYDHDVTPIVEITRNGSDIAVGHSSPVSMDAAIVRALADVPLAVQPERGTFWFSLVPVVDGVEGKPLYESPRVQITGHGGTMPVTLVNNYLVSAECNPRPVGGNAQVSVTLQRSHP